MDEQRPTVLIVAGPNGAGKSTAAPSLLPTTLGMSDFVNADVIARGLSGFSPEKVAFQAGQIMLRRVQQLAEQRANFAFETTLASRTLEPWLRRLCSEGYELLLAFLWLPTPDAAIARVLERVRLGGHSVPEETIRRRYHRGLHNFFNLYRPLAQLWRFYDNSSVIGPRLLAHGKGCNVEVVYDLPIWDRLLKGLADEPATQADDS